MVIKRRIIIQGNNNDVNKEMKDDVSKKPIERLSEASQKQSEECTEFNLRQCLMKGKITTSKEIITVEMINENPQKYYGVYVNYECQNHEIKWKIFSSDGDKIYLIASDYIPTKYIPLQRDDSLEYIVAFGNITRHYKNLAGIENAEPVKYMLDKVIWNYFCGFVNTQYAVYAMGGPTLELLFESYNKKYGTNYKHYQPDEYLISDNGGITLKFYDIMLSIDDELYVITNKEKAYGYWIASFCNIYTEYYLFNVACTGSISYAPMYNRTLGFRPVICLKPGVAIKKLSDGTYDLVL